MAAFLRFAKKLLTLKSLLTNLGNAANVARGVCEFMGVGGNILMTNKWPKTFMPSCNTVLNVLQEVLIHLGAKFSPCMRQDEEIHRLIQEKKAKERESGCCVRNDRSGCLQTLQEECSVRETK